MRERKYVKIRVDMYDDTKFKIIDMKPERDLIHYVWTRLVTLAGKVDLEGDLEGDLYLSKNIPYTVETLALEFNRGIDQVKLAIDVLIELEMVEITQDNIYRVKNFAKHQNIKKREEAKDINNKKTQVKDNLKNKINYNENKEFENKVNADTVTNVSNDQNNNVQICYEHMNTINNFQENIPIYLKKRTKENKNKKKDNSIKIREVKKNNKSVCQSILRYTPSAILAHSPL